MLFSSVGFMKAQTKTIDIAVPKGETVKLTIASRSFTFLKTNYPKLNEGAIIPSGFDSKTLEWTLKPEADTKYELATEANDWGNLSIKLDGKVTSFDAGAETPLSKLVTSLEFVDNGVLSVLNLGKSSQHLTDAFPNLKILKCAGNKLNYIPSKQEGGKDKIATYEVGEQSPSSNMLSIIAFDAKSGYTLKVADFDKSASTIFSSEPTSLSISGLENDKKENVFSYVKSESGKYFFKDGDIFMDGEFTAKIAVGSDDKNYPDVVICGVPVKVNAATFTLDKDKKITIEPKGAGTINAEPADKLSSLTRNTVVKLTPAPNSGYEFDKFEIVAGLEAAGQDGNSYSFKVKGDKDPEIKAIFKAKGATVTYNTPDAAQGTLRVTKVENNELVASGNTVPVGTKLLITAKAKDGYNVGNVSFKKADKSGVLTPNPEEGKKDANEKTWTYEVTIDGLDVQAAFTALTKALTTTTPNIKVTDTKGKEYTWKENKFDIPVGTELVFTLKPGASKVVSSVIINSESYEVTELQDGTFTWKGFVMPEQDSKMVVTTSDLFDLNSSVQLVSTCLTYTGDPLAVDFTVNKNVDKTSFKVEYKVSGAGDNTYTEKPFANYGTYIARITRPADGVYAAYEKGFEYTIVKAQLIVEAPKVTVDEDGKFVFTGGKAYYINGDTKVELTGGKFVAISSSSPSEIENPEQNDGGKVKVKYRLPETVLATNFEVPTSTAVIYDSEVATATIQAVGAYKDALTFKNGNLVLPSSSKVAQGTTVTFDYEKVDGVSASDKLTYAIYQANASGEKLSGAADLITSGYKIQEADKDQTLYFLLEVEDERTELALSDQAKKYIQEGKFVYEDSKLPFDFTKGSSEGLYFVDKEGKEIADDNLYSSTYFSITYWKKNGGQVAEAIDAGDYQVKIARKASPSYKEFEEVTLDFTIDPANIPEGIGVPTPTASMIGKGQTLGTSKLSGNADIAGEYRWDEGNNVIVNATKLFGVTFYPEDKNYKPKQIKDQVEVKVSDKPILTITCDETKGTVKVYDGDNKYYYDGDAIDVHQLTFEAIPAEGYAFESYSVIHGGTPSTEKIAIFTTTPNGSSIDVTVNFKEKSAEIVYHKINISTSGVGFAVSTTSGLVKEGDSFNFNMSAHPSDYTSIVVRDNKGKSYKVSSSGACTIDNVQEDLQLTVSLSNPTKYNVTLLADEYKDSEGNLMGTATFSGNTYYGGTITLTAVPKEGYKFVGWLNAGTTISTLATAQITVTSNMAITAQFESDGTIDPTTECIVRTPYDENVPGVHINKQGINVVKIGSNFEFSVAAYEADLARVKVTVDGVELKPDANNKYVLEKVQKSTEVKVTLANPTRIKVVVEKETKNAKGYVMGHVDVEGLASDSTCYYNTTIRLAAYPESGVEFMNWSDVTSNTQLIRELTITKELTIKPVFSGTPTGIEDIMAASIATGKGCVWVRGIANADVTIVSMAGRVQARQRISGDTRINVPAGIYVILLESGSDVKRAKVIVK